MIEKTYPTEKYKENNNNYSDYDSEEYKWKIKNINYVNKVVS